MTLPLQLSHFSYIPIIIDPIIEIHVNEYIIACPHLWVWATNDWLLSV